MVVADGRFESRIEVWAGGGPRDQADEAADRVGVVAWLVVWTGGVAILLIEG